VGLAQVTDTCPSCDRLAREVERMREALAALLVACDGSEDVYAWATAVDRARAALEEEARP